jgi:hypothetical protein
MPSLPPPATRAPAPSRPDRTRTGPLPTGSRRAYPARHDGLEGWRVLSGTGEDLGVVVGIEHDAFGRPKKLAFVESEGDEPRFVPLRFLREVRDGAVRLAGPREGYHITRVRAPIRRMREWVGDDEDP